jgi:hypothetical protein
MEADGHRARVGSESGQRAAQLVHNDETEKTEDEGFIWSNTTVSFLNNSIAQYDCKFHLHSVHNDYISTGLTQHSHLFA